MRRLACLVALVLALGALSAPSAEAAPRTTASAAGVTVTSLCTSTLEVASALRRVDYRVTSRGRVLVPVSWAAPDVTSYHYLGWDGTVIRPGQPLHVSGRGVRLTVHASPRRCP